MGVPQEGSGKRPLLMWKQTYVGSSRTSFLDSSSVLVSDVRLVVRKFFESSLVDVEDVTFLVVYTPPSVDGVEVYVIQLLVRGYLIAGSEGACLSWGPDMSSGCHHLVSSMCVAASNHRVVNESFVQLDNTFHHNEQCVLVERVAWNAVLQSIVSFVLWSRPCLESSYRESVAWPGEGEALEREELDSDLVYV